MSRDETTSLEPTLLGAIWCHRFLVALTVLLGVGLGLVLTSQERRGTRYEAVARIALRTSQQYPLAGTGATQQEIEQYITEQVLLLRSREVTERAATLINRSLDSPDVTPLDVAASVAIIQPSRSSDVSGNALTSIRYVSSTPGLAIVGANAVLVAYSEARRDDIRSKAESARSQTRAAIQSRSREVDELTRRLATTPSGSPSYLALSKELENLVSRHGTLMARLDQIDIEEHQALLTQSPPIRAEGARELSENATLRMPLEGGVFGMIVGSTVAYAFFARRRRFMNHLEPEALFGVPSLGEVAIARRRSGFNDPEVTADVSYQFIASSLQALGGSGEGLRAVVVAPMKDSGNTALVANVVLALADRRKRVVAVDASSPQGDLARRVNSKGPRAALVEVPEAIPELRESNHENQGQLSTLPGLVVLTTDGLSGLGRDGQSALHNVLSRINTQYDYVLVDAPPLLTSPLAAELVTIVGTVVVLVNHRDRVRDHAELSRILRLLGSEVSGYVYNYASRPYRAGIWRRVTSRSRIAKGGKRP